MWCALVHALVIMHQHQRNFPRSSPLVVRWSSCASTSATSPGVRRWTSAGRHAPVQIVGRALVEQRTTSANDKDFSVFFQNDATLHEFQIYVR